MYSLKVSSVVDYLNCVISYNGAQAIRYIEYSLSAPLMVVAIGLSFGILDVYTLIALGVFTSSCNLFGLAADVFRVQARDAYILQELVSQAGPIAYDFRDVLQQMSKSLKKYMYVFHFVGWFLIIIPWALIWVVFFALYHQQNDEICGTRPMGDRQMPAEVLYLNFGEATLFALFGLVQFVQMMFYFEDNSLSLGTKVEFAFVALSLIAKSSLGMVIFSSSLFT